MKKNKLKSLVKSSRKDISKQIEKTLIENTISSLRSFELDSKKAKKEIAKASKKLAETLSNLVKINEKELIQQAKNRQTAVVTSATISETMPAISPEDMMSFDESSSHMINKITAPEALLPEIIETQEPADINSETS